MRTKPNNTTYFKIDTQQEPIVLSKHLMDILLSNKNSSDCIALYCFYYYTAKWQKTNQPKATTEYTAKGLNWGIGKVRMIKNILRELHLIEDIVIRKDNVIIGHFIKVNFIWTNINSHPNDFPQYGSSHSMEINKGNTLSKSKRNTLSKSNLNAKENLTIKDFEKFWKVYPKKTDKGKALKSWVALTNKKDKPTLKTIMFAIRDQKRTERWQDPQFIPMPSTWINQTRWIDDPNEMKIFKKVTPQQQTSNTVGYKETNKKYREPDLYV